MTFKHCHTLGMLNKLYQIYEPNRNNIEIKTNYRRNNKEEKSLYI